MEERLKELKEKIASFVNDYDVKNFYVDIEEWAKDVVTETKYYDVEIEIRV